MSEQVEKPDRHEILRRTRELLIELGMAEEDVPDEMNADIRELEDRRRELERLRARQLATTYRSGRG